MEEAIQRHLRQRVTSSKLLTQIGYLHSEAYYLYTQGFMEEAINVWEEILALDNANEAAIDYMQEARDKIRAGNKPREVIREERRGIVSMRQKKLGPTQSQYSHSKISHNELMPEYKIGENRYFDHSFSILRNEQRYGTRTHRSLTGLTENIRADTIFGDYKSTFIASLNYDHTPGENYRDPRHITFTAEEDWWRFMAGDNSTYLSRYVFNGLNYRGFNFAGHTDESVYPINRFKTFYGVAKVFDEQSEHYFYPIEFFGVRNEVEIKPSYKVGVSFGYQFHENSIARVNSLFHPKQNRLYSIDQFIKPADWWVIRHEIAYSRMDNETHNRTIWRQKPDREDWAHYITSNILREDLQLYNVYEYAGPEFYSLTGEVEFFKNTTPNDREIFENMLIYTPTDQFLVELQYHRFRTNLEDDARKETTKENWFKGLALLTPKDSWLPAIGIRGSLLRSRTLPGSSDITDKKYTRDIGVELLKTLLGVDWTLSYGFQKSYEDLNYKYCDVYRHIGTAKGQVGLIPDRLNLNALYSFADLDILAPVGDITSSAHENKFDAYIAARLWGGSNLSFGYHYFNRRDYVGTFEDLDSHTGSIVFNWPYTKNFLGRRKLTLNPHLSYYYTKNDEYTDFFRTMFSTRLDANYYFANDNKITCSLEYIDGVDGSDRNQEGSEVRFMTTYRAYISPNKHYK